MFDRVYDRDTTQEVIYDTAVKVSLGSRQDLTEMPLSLYIHVLTEFVVLFHSQLSTPSYRCVRMHLLLQFLSLLVSLFVYIHAD